MLASLDSSDSSDDSREFKSNFQSRREAEGDRLSW